VGGFSGEQEEEGEEGRGGGGKRRRRRRRREEEELRQGPGVPPTTRRSAPPEPDPPTAQRSQAPCSHYRHYLYNVRNMRPAVKYVSEINWLFHKKLFSSETKHKNPDLCGFGI
jgi:hypothetical protein